ncbi:hypothetical protein Tco_0860721 [Tanacetum coccineum]|uniref:Uncharacterized protein n=1 Tax=Tanacetum coccineum TaxID=301880 RepID=A0ABQ5BJT1_9ASTR
MNFDHGMKVRFQRDKDLKGDGLQDAVPAVQQLWTFCIPGKQTAICFKMTNTQTPPTVVNTTGAPVTNAVANHAEKPEKFNETAPQFEPPAEVQSTNHRLASYEAWKHSDFLCHNYVLNGLIDPLYNVYCKTTTAKELWESLERKYKTEDAGTKKFVVARFLDYKMVDSKSVVISSDSARFFGSTDKFMLRNDF